MKKNCTDPDMFEISTGSEKEMTILWTVVHCDIMGFNPGEYENDELSYFERLKGGETITFELVEKTK